MMYMQQIMKILLKRVSKREYAIRKLLQFTDTTGGVNIEYDEIYEDKNWVVPDRGEDKNLQEELKEMPSIDCYEFRRKVKSI